MEDETGRRVTPSFSDTKTQSTAEADLCRAAQNAFAEATEDAILRFLDTGYKIEDLVLVNLPSEFNEHTGKLTIRAKIEVHSCYEDADRVQVFLAALQSAGMKVNHSAGMKVNHTLRHVYFSGWISCKDLENALDAYSEHTSEKQI